MGESNRIYLTKESIRRSLLQQIESKDIAHVKASDVIAGAHVSKATFYRYYKDVYDLLTDCFLEYLDVQEEALEAIQNGGLPKVHRNLILEGMRRIKEYPRLYLMCIKCSYGPFVNDFNARSIFRSVNTAREFIRFNGINDKNCLIDVDTLATLCVSLSTDIDVRWVQGGCLEDPEQIADLSSLCVTRFIEAMRTNR